MIALAMPLPCASGGSSNTSWCTSNSPKLFRVKVRRMIMFSPSIWPNASIRRRAGGPECDSHTTVTSPGMSSSILPATSAVWLVLSMACSILGSTIDVAIFICPPSFLSPTLAMPAESRFHGTSRNFTPVVPAVARFSLPPFPSSPHRSRQPASSWEHPPRGPTSRTTSDSGLVTSSQSRRTARRFLGVGLAI